MGEANRRKKLDPNFGKLQPQNFERDKESSSALSSNSATNNICDLITKSHSSTAADAYRDFLPTEQQRQRLYEVGREVLSNFPNIPGACAPMSTLYAARWQQESDTPIYVVAGKLNIEDNPVFGSEIDANEIGSVLSQSNSSWDGHCWLVFGPYIVDISIFRTAYSDYSPAILASHVTEKFGKNRGILVAEPSALAEHGFQYIPQYVFTEELVTGHCLGAAQIFEAQ
jgi:hypothetical protein